MSSLSEAKDRPPLTQPPSSPATTPQIVVPGKPVKTKEARANSSCRGNPVPTVGRGGGHARLLQPQTGRHRPTFITSCGLRKAIVILEPPLMSSLSEAKDLPPITLNRRPPNSSCRGNNVTPYPIRGRYPRWGKGGWGSTFDYVPVRPIGVPPPSPRPLLLSSRPLLLSSRAKPRDLKRPSHNHAS